MMKKRSGIVVLCVFSALFLLQLPLWGVQNAPPDSRHRSAAVVASARNATILGAAWAGPRIVGVGEQGVVLLSDDQGKSFRQAKSVPTRSTLNGVCFVNEREGWAVGHSGMILHTGDGGESWKLQREDEATDRPLFTVWFKDARQGLAGGLWGLLLRTTDGGASWEEVKLPIPPARKKADKNLFAIFPGRNGDLFIAAERGTVYKSRDNGQSWKEVATGSPGTLWTGTALKSGAIVVAGLRGRILRSEDDGEHWSEVCSGTKSSITAIAETGGGELLAVGLDGTSLHGTRDGRAFSVSSRPDRLALTAVLVTSHGAPVVFSEQGPLSR